MLESMHKVACWKAPVELSMTAAESTMSSSALGDPA
jgi:hypothetical protein